MVDHHRQPADADADGSFAEADVQPVSKNYTRGSLGLVLDRD